MHWLDALIKCVRGCSDRVPLMTGRASCSDNCSGISKSSSCTDGHNTAFPFWGLTARSNRGNAVSPPSSTSDRYKKKVKMRGPQAWSPVKLPEKSKWALYFWPRSYLRIWKLSLCPVVKKQSLKSFTSKIIHNISGEEIGLNYSVQLGLEGVDISE